MSKDFSKRSKFQWLTDTGENANNWKYKKKETEVPLYPSENDLHLWIHESQLLWKNSTFLMAESTPMDEDVLLDVAQFLFLFWWASLLTPRFQCCGLCCCNTGMQATLLNGDYTSSGYIPFRGIAESHSRSLSMINSIVATLIYTPTNSAVEHFLSTSRQFWVSLYIRFTLNHRMNPALNTKFYK